MKEAHTDFDLFYREGVRLGQHLCHHFSDGNFYFSAVFKCIIWKYRFVSFQ